MQAVVVNVTSEGHAMRHVAPCFDRLSMTGTTGVISRVAPCFDRLGMTGTTGVISRVAPCSDRLGMTGTTGVISQAGGRTLSRLRLRLSHLASTDTLRCVSPTGRSYLLGLWQHPKAC